MCSALDCEDKSDEELVVLTLQNRECFVCIINRYENKLLRYMKRISNMPEEELQDILQETFIKAYYNLNNFDSDLKFSSWVYRIAHNSIIDAHRKNKIRPQGNLVDIEDSLLQNIASDTNVLKEVDQKYIRKNIEDALENMEQKYREVLVLKFFEEKDYKEISDILKKPMGTVATLLNRAKKKLKEEIIKQGTNPYQS
ncbi:MAG: sigma-70 family RNA polymerase sigma factor [Candidatus Pacebacteria bacterium]|nr:sigma-70 family RNA polymerase sigma factor [Candidatus Paceibacterota bacterium]